jgi:hypothetical protein
MTERPASWQPEHFGNLKRIPQSLMRSEDRGQVAIQVAKSARTRLATWRASHHSLQSPDTLES